MNWTQVCYCYDGSFAGFLCCIYHSYFYHEIPACFSTPDDLRLSLWPQREVANDRAQAGRVYRSLAEKISPGARALVARGFLTCLPERELHLWRLIRLGYRQGARLMSDLTANEVCIVRQAVHHLEHEAHLLKGFVRFSDQEGVLVSQISPKNRVLPLLQPHFCSRYPGEAFIIHDRTHRQALFHRQGQWAIVPLEAFQIGAPGEDERAWRGLWRRFYDTIAIEGRYNPKCRMTQMPKRYWENMTEFQTDPAGPALPSPEGSRTGLSFMGS